MAGLDDEAAVVAFEPTHLQLLRVLEGKSLAGPRLLALGILLDRAAELAQLREHFV